jgi:hypothetical protein
MGVNSRVAAKITAFTVEGTTQSTGSITNTTFYNGLEIRLINLITKTTNLKTILLKNFQKFGMNLETILDIRVS